MEPKFKLDAKLHTNKHVSAQSCAPVVLIIFSTQRPSPCIPQRKCAESLSIVSQESDDLSWFLVFHVPTARKDLNREGFTMNESSVCRVPPPVAKCSSQREQAEAGAAAAAPKGSLSGQVSV